MKKNIETKHTPGPWKARWSNVYGDTCKIIANDEHGAIATIRLRYSKGNNTTEWSANAHLIAAAPELLKTVNDFIFLEKTNMTKKQMQLQIDIAKNLINKIQGKPKRMTTPTIRTGLMMERRRKPH